jgi:branched-subunit amino acid transport protein
MPPQRGRAYAQRMSDSADQIEPVQQGARAEHRWPAVVGLVLALALYATLPSTFLPGLRYTVVFIGLALLIPLVALNPHRLHRETRWSKYLATGEAVLLVAANEVALVQLVIQLTSGAQGDGPNLLLAALQVWVTNVIAFALIYWEIDRGGPVSRRHASRRDFPPADFRFPQDEDHDAIEEVAARSSQRIGWVASFFDYVYFSLSNSMAFSPTDTMPLSIRAKALMALESFGGFVLLALVIARAVSLLG